MADEEGSVRTVIARNVPGDDSASRAHGDQSLAEPQGVKPPTAIRIALVFYRFGPYHLARLLAIRKLTDAIGIEFTRLDHVYQWEAIKVPEGVTIYSFFSGPVKHKHSAREVYAEALRCLSEIRADVVALPGWDTGFTLTILRAAHVMGIPAIVMSETQRIDFPRTPIKEWVKRQVVGLYSSAIVGGQVHEEYMAELGMRPEAIFHCMDAIDNEHFATAREFKSGFEGRPTFLASARFIPKKNLIGLLTAYDLYRQEAGEQAWDLRILGDGPLKKDIEGFVREKRLGKHVSLPGFVQYPDLPRQYAQATVFVHASTSEPWGLVVNEAMAAGLPVLISERCGCARDLVKSGINGFTFNPFDSRELSALMMRVTLHSDKLKAMGEASQKIIKGWSVEFFAEQLLMAAKYAIDQPAARASSLRLKALDVLARLW